MTRRVPHRNCWWFRVDYCRPWRWEYAYDTGRQIRWQRAWRVRFAEFCWDEQYWLEWWFETAPETGMSMAEMRHRAEEELAMLDHLAVAP